MITFNVYSRAVYADNDGYAFIDGTGYSFHGNKLYVEGYCLEDDTKPLVADAPFLANGSKLTEIDTGDVYLYNEEDDEWTVLGTASEPADPADNGGGGGE